MESARTYKQSSSSCYQDKNVDLAMHLQNILLKFYKSAQDVLEQHCLENLTQVIQNMETAQQNCLNSVQTALFILLSQIQTIKQKNQIPVDHNDYQVLQQSLQKAESQVRKHIRIEQQLKLYLDGVQQKNQNLQKQLKIQETKYHQLFQSMKSIDQQKKELQKKLKKIEQRNKFLSQKQKLKGHKSAKLISESMSRMENQSVSMYKSKPFLSNHHHSKSKTSEKSFQRQKNDMVIGLQKKNSKVKHLDGQIDVNLSKNLNQQSKQQKTVYGEPYIPTQQDIRIFRQMTKTVQMKQAYKRPVRKVTKYKTQSKEGKQIKDLKSTFVNQPENRQYRSVSMYK